MKINLANILTLMRIAAIPVIVFCFYSSMEFARPIAGIVFGLAALTDMLDGYAARKLGQTSKFGEFLDPVADKLIVVTALVLLIGHHATLTMTFAGMVIIGREIVVSALREWMAEVNRRGLVVVSWVGKVKTGFQMAAIIVLLANPPSLEYPWAIVGVILLYIAVFMTLWSMITYIRAAWPTLLAGDQEMPDEDGTGK